MVFNFLFEFLVRFLVSLIVCRVLSCAGFKRQRNIDLCIRRLHHLKTKSFWELTWVPKWVPMRKSLVRKLFSLTSSIWIHLIWLYYNDWAELRLNPIEFKLLELWWNDKFGGMSISCRVRDYWNWRPSLCLSRYCIWVLCRILSRGPCYGWGCFIEDVVRRINRAL